MEHRNIEVQWKLFYRIGAVSAFLALLVMMAEIGITALPDGARELHTIEEVFEMYHRNWFMAMRFMGLMNIFATSLMIPVFFALFGLHREKMLVVSGFALIIHILGFAVFMADNTSFAMLEVADKYFATGSVEEKTVLLSAGEALFAKGASHTPGTFPGFLIGEISSILFSVIILRGGQLKKAVGVIGLLSFSFLLIFEIISSFVGSMFKEAMVFAMTGGILALVWYVLIGIGLWKYTSN
jgi:hypothetical protein